MALKLSLKPNEKLIVNGAVIANTDRRATLVVHNKASILREKDILQENDVTTPARRVYFPVMLMYMDDKGRDKYYDEFVLRMTEFMSAISTPEAVAACVSVSKDVMDRKYYRALMTCKKLIAFEAELLSAPADTEAE